MSLLVAGPVNDGAAMSKTCGVVACMPVLVVVEEEEVLLLPGRRLLADRDSRELPLCY